MKPHTLLTRPEPKYINSDGVLEFIEAYAGYRLSKSSLYQMTMDKLIPFRKGPGNRLLFPISEIKDWIENAGQMPEPIQTEA